MTIQSLEDCAKSNQGRQVNAQGICMACGTYYDLAERRASTLRLPQPNTADSYCSDRCWVLDTSINE